jgi:mRNA interferase RelE/StbE
MAENNKFKNYKIELTNSATKDLNKLEDKIIKRVKESLSDLVDGKPNVDCKKLKGKEHTYRIRTGDFRIIFEQQKSIITILVIEIVSRKNAYKGS